VVQYYGATVPLQQLGSVSVSDGNTLVVNVFDAGAISSVEKAIMSSDLGLNPQTDGAIIRLRLPDLTEDRRNELVKYVKKLSEEAKVSLRNIRRDELDAIKKQDDLSDDDKKRASESIQKLLDQYIAKVDDLVTQKEDEIRTI
jgi:ribosome recycling factor